MRPLPHHAWRGSPSETMSTSHRHFVSRAILSLLKCCKPTKSLITRRKIDDINTIYKLIIIITGNFIECRAVLHTCLSTHQWAGLGFVVNVKPIGALHLRFKKRWTKVNSSQARKLAGDLRAGYSWCLLYMEILLLFFHHLKKCLLLSPSQTFTPKHVCSFL